MAFLDKNGLQTLTNKLVQGDAIKVASHRGHTVANVIDNITRECENVATPNTMTLENRVSEFKVGKGRDVDVSGDVEEGKIEVELQGKTWQNVVPKMENGYMLSGSQSKVEDGIAYIKANGKDHMQKYWTGSDIQLIKPNTTYTVISYIYENYLDRSFNIINNYAGKNGDLALTSAVVSRGYTGIYIGTFRTKESFEDAKRLGFLVYNNTNGTVVFSVPYILEGDHTQTPTEELPKYLEGIKSSFEDGIVDVEVQGKNLFDINKAYDFSNWFEGAYKSIDLNLVEGKKYSIQMDIDTQGNNMWIGLFGEKGGYHSPIYTPVWGKPYTGKVVKTFVAPKNTYLSIYHSNGITSSNFDKYFKNIISNIQIEEFLYSTSYEPYYKKKISFNIGEPLRSLPNGVYDEINKLGIETRRVGKTVLNGSENWLLDKNIPEKENQITFYTNVSNMIELNSVNLLNFINDKFPVTRDTINLDVEGLSGFGKNIRVSIFKNKLSSPNVEGFKTWLQTNPITVYYELAEPIITPIEPMEFDVKPLATMTINSEIAPISNHKVVLNRAEQIEQGIVQIAELKKRIDTLETAYDSYLLETQHKLSLLGFEYELESEEI